MRPTAIEAAVGAALDDGWRTADLADAGRRRATACVVVGTTGVRDRRASRRSSAGVPATGVTARGPAR